MGEEEENTTTLSVRDWKQVTNVSNETLIFILNMVKNVIGNKVFLVSFSIFFVFFNLGIYIKYPLHHVSTSQPRIKFGY